MLSNERASMSNFCRILSSSISSTIDLTVLDGVGIVGLRIAVGTIFRLETLFDIVFEFLLDLRLLWLLLTLLVLELHSLLVF